MAGRVGSYWSACWAIISPHKGLPHVLQVIPITNLQQGHVLTFHLIHFQGWYIHPSILHNNIPHIFASHSIFSSHALHFLTASSSSSSVHATTIIIVQCTLPHGSPPFHLNSTRPNPPQAKKNQIHIIKHHTSNAPPNQSSRESIHPSIQSSIRSTYRSMYPCNARA